MASRNHNYALIAALHDLLEDIETYDRQRADAADCSECRQIWDMLKTRAEEAVALIRAEVARHAED